MDALSTSRVFDRLATYRGWAWADARPRRMREGAWAFYLPALGAKFLHGRDGYVVCHHPGAPDPAQLRARPDRSASWGAYSLGEWMDVYAKDVVTRVAENLVAAARLHRAGLGPRPLGVCHARRYRRRGRDDRWGAIGFLTEDVWALPRKPDCTDTDIVAAGVRVDKLRSSVRQQLNGYVTDLNSVVGVAPIDADEEVQGLRQAILTRFALPDPLHRAR